MKDYNCLKGMIGNAESMLKTAYDRGYEQGQQDNADCVSEKTYERGVRDMFDAFYKILAHPKNGGIELSETIEILGTGVYQEICEMFKDNPALLIENIREYENKKKSENVTKYCSFMNDTCPYTCHCDICAVANVIMDARKAKENVNENKDNRKV